MRDRSIGIAISGGGQRAALFGLGALMYMADAGLSNDVTSIASVSGGGMTNGFVAQQCAFDEIDGEDFELAMTPLAVRIATQTVWWYWLTGLWALALLVVVAGLVGIWTIDVPAWLQIVAFVLGLALFGWVAGLRSSVCERAMRARLYNQGGSATKLADLAHRRVEHVFCATDLHAGEHVYFSPRFVCAYRYGWGSPGDLPLSFPVQAAAALPGAFSPRWPRVSRLGFHEPMDPGASNARRMTLTDGGVYDNMADQWVEGVPKRNERWAAQHPGLKEATHAVIVNASAGMEWTGTKSLGIPLLGELLALKRDESVLYDNGTSVRREMLIARFDETERCGGDLTGCLVHIAQSPYRVPDHFATDTGLRGDRARAAQAALAAAGSDRDLWKAHAHANASVKTTLSKLGAKTSADLLHHAYVLAMVNLYVVLDAPLLPMPARERFEEMVS